MAFEASTVDLARRQLEAIGFEVVVGEHARSRHGYFAGTDAERAADLAAMFAAPDVAGIVCYTGGWGTPRILPLLDYEAIRRHPKVLIGYSDVTALLNAIHQETGLVTFHGPMAAWDIRPWTLDGLKRVVMTADPIGVLAKPPKGESELVSRDYRILTLRGGRARGRLVGGNLTMLASLMGTPWEVDTAGAILFLEDVHESYYRIDRMLTQLRLGGKLERLAGVVFGYCSECPTDAPSFSFEEILHDFFAALGVPASPAWPSATSRRSSPCRSASTPPSTPMADAHLAEARWHERLTRLAWSISGHELATQAQSSSSRASLRTRPAHGHAARVAVNGVDRLGQRQRATLPIRGR
jgi:muramoyltetrapeptide carboxypeptidase